MRPEYLKMSGFGPYSKVTEIDFGKLGKSGLYLITGDTGAGKTSIFDAIAYALFGSPSGDNRDSSMLRSQYADESLKTEVELVFTYNGKKYTVRRNPEYTRKKTRGEGTTKETADAELIYPDNRIVTKSTAVTKAVEEILGINRNQFCQIAMIAQGDFRKLLFAPTDDRTKIFRHIFKTDNYSKMQNQLKDTTGQLKRQCDSLRESINQYISDICCSDESPLSLDVHEAVSGNLPAAEVITLLDKLIEADSAAEEKIEKMKEENRKLLESVSLKINSHKKRVELQKSLQAKEADLEVNLKQTSKLNADFEAAKAQEPEIINNNEKSATLTAVLPDYDEFNEKVSLFFKNVRDIRNIQDNLDKLYQEKKSLSDSVERDKVDRKSLENAEEQKAKLEAVKKELEENIIKHLKAQESIRKMEAAKTAYQASAKEYVFKKIRANKADYEFRNARNIYLDAQAGVLAEKLAEGMPCPVCGSLNHPSLAVKPAEAPSKEALDHLEQFSKEAINDAHEASKEAEKRKGSWEELSRTAAAETEELLGKSITDKTNEQLDAALSDLDKSVKDLNMKLNEENKRILRRENTDKLLQEHEKRIAEVSIKIIELDKELSNKVTENKHYEDRINLLKEKLEYKSKAEAEAEIKRLDEASDRIRKALEEARRKQQECTNHITALKAEVAQLKKQLDSMEEIDIDTVNAEYEKRKADERQLDEYAKKINTILTANRKTRENIEKKIPALAKKEEEYTSVKSLSDTANGNISSKEKIQLETYVQMHYFDRILQRANTRLAVLTEGQYDLVRRTEGGGRRSQSGLELDVTDHYSGSIRSVKSLSGGEAFKASLALALGLADEIQYSAGGINLDTMFIDEGFGSLDEESLNQAIATLNGLAESNRLIGIISHVEELKRRIDKQIIVKKDKYSGSYIEDITVF